MVSEENYTKVGVKQMLFVLFVSQNLIPRQLIQYFLIATCKIQGYTNYSNKISKSIYNLSQVSN